MEGWGEGSLVLPSVLIRRVSPGSMMPIECHRHGRCLSLFINTDAPGHFPSANFFVLDKRDPMNDMILYPLLSGWGGGAVSLFTCRWIFKKEGGRLVGVASG